MITNPENVVIRCTPKPPDVEDTPRKKKLKSEDAPGHDHLPDLNTPKKDKKKPSAALGRATSPSPKKTMKPIEITPIVSNIQKPRKPAIKTANGKPRESGTISPQPSTSRAGQEQEPQQKPKGKTLFDYGYLKLAKKLTVSPPRPAIPKLMDLKSTAIKQHHTLHQNHTGLHDFEM